MHVRRALYKFITANKVCVIKLWWVWWSQRRVEIKRDPKAEGNTFIAFIFPIFLLTYLIILLLPSYIPYI